MTGTITMGAMMMTRGIELNVDGKREVRKSMPQNRVVKADSRQRYDQRLVLFPALSSRVHALGIQDCCPYSIVQAFISP